MSRFIRHISVILVAVIIFTSIPMNTYAKENETPAKIEAINSYEADEVSEKDDVISSDDIAKEISEKSEDIDTKTVDEVSESTKEKNADEIDDASVEINNNPNEYISETESSEDDIEEISDALDEDYNADAGSSSYTEIETAPGELAIDDYTGNKENPEDGWSYTRQDGGVLTLNGAHLKKIDISTNVKIVVEGDSEIKNNTGRPFYMHKNSDSGVDAVYAFITSSNGSTLSIISDQTYYEAISTDGKSNRGIDIYDNVIVDCQTDYSSKAAIDIGEGYLKVIKGATLKASSKQYSAIKSNGGNITVKEGSKVYAYTAAKFPVIQLGTNGHLTVTGENSVLTTDRSTTNSTTNSISGSGTNSSLTIEDHSTLLMKNCNTGYAPIRFDNSSVEFKNARVEIHSSSESDLFQSGNYLLYTGRDKFTHTADLDGAIVEQNEQNDKLKLTTATNCWKYIGNKPFLQFTTEPATKTTVKKGDDIHLSVEAELKESSETPNITYQWYMDDQAVSGATGTTINQSTTELNLGVHTLYCQAQMHSSEVGIIEQNSDKAIVYVTSDGRTPRTEELTLSIQNTCTNAEEGWSWNADTRTLTLSNFVQYVEDENKYGINLPANSTLILQGENIIQTKKMSPIYAQGNLMMYGSGNATLYSQVPQDSYKHLGVSTTGILNLYADITKGDADSTSGVKQVWDTDEGLYIARIESNNSPLLLIDSKPEEKIFTSSVGGTAPEIEIGAKLINTAEGTTTDYEYQWYITDDWSNPTADSQPVTGATSAKLTAPVNERGGRYYYCKVTATNNGIQYSIISDVYCVVVGARGKKPVTEKQEISLESIDKSEYGVKYTMSDEDITDTTLTLDNVEVFIPFATASGASKTAFHINGSTKLKIVLADGSINNISSSCGAFWLTGETVDELNIKGKGTLNYENGVSTYGMIFLPANGVGSMKVSDGAVVNELSGSTDFKNNDDIVVSNATYRLCNRGTTINSITVENGGKLYTSSTNALKAKNITVAKGGEMEVEGLNASSYAVCIDDTDGELSVGGTLLITSKNKNLLGIKYSELKDSASRIKLTDNTKLLSPDGCEVADLFLTHVIGYDIYGTNQKNLLIAPGTFKKTAISRAGAITGDMCVGCTVSAGSFTPSDATVAYQWQYADSANAADSFWNNISGAISSTYLIDNEEYTGKYLRVKITGIGMYTGTIYSKTTSPVSADGATMVDFIADGFSLGKYNRSDALILTYNNDVPDEVSLRVMAEDPSAQIIIKNVTSGFTEKTDEEKTINGAAGMMPVHYTSSGWNYNNIKVTITSGEITKEYNVKLGIDVKETKLILNTNSETGLILMDEEHGLDNSLNNLSGGECDDYDAIPGHNYTLAVYMIKDGRYPTGLGCDNSYIDEKESSIDDENETRIISFTMPRGRTIKFDAGIVGYRIFAPSATADWAYEEEVGYYINVQYDNTHTITADDGYDNRMCAELIDQDGNKITLRAKSDSNPEGFYTYSNQDGDNVGTIFRVDKAGNKVSLDPTKSYTLKLWYGATTIEKCDVKEIKLASPALNMGRHKIVIKKPSDTETTANVLMNENAKTFKVEQYPGDSASGVKVEPNGNEVKVTVQPTAAIGNVYAMIYQRIPSGETIGDILTIQVASSSENVYVGLGETSGTLDIYKDTDLIIPINTTNTVADIVSASFVESNKPLLSDKYTIEINNNDIDGPTATGRALIVKPANMPSATADQVDWASVVNSYKGTFKAKIKIVIQEDPSDPATKKEYITNQIYTMAIGGTAPVVKAGAINFNSFYQGNKQNINLTTKNGTITQAVVDTSKTKGRTVACPPWVQLGTSGLDASLINNALVNKKISSKLYLNAVIDGYRIPAQVTVSVSAAYTEPKVKLSESTVTVPADATKYVAGKQLTLLSSDKKVDYSSLGITNIRVINTYDLANMSTKDQKTYMASKYFTVTNFDTAAGTFALKKASSSNITEIASGKVLLIATVNGNAAQEIRIPLNVKAADATKATIKADKSSVTINSNLDSSVNDIYGAQAQYIKIIPSVSGISMAGTTWTVTDSKGKGDYLSSLSIVSIDAAVDRYSIKTNAQTTDGTYKVNFSVPGIAKPATVTVNVKGTVPTIKLSKSTVTLDRILGYKNPAYRETTIGIALSDDTISRKNSDFSYAVTNSKKLDVTGEGEIGVSFVNGGSGMKVTLGDAVKTDTYTVNITYTMPSGKEAKTKASVKVTAKAPTFKTDRKSVTLNPDLGNKDCSVIMISLPDEYAYDASQVKVYDNKKNETDTAIKCDGASSGILKLYALGSAVRGTTYKVKYTKPYYALGEGGYASAEISVSIPKAGKNGKSAITQKLSAKGSLDVSRTKSAIQIIPTYNGWNKNVYTNSSDDPQVSWKVYAYDKKNKPYYCGDSSYQYETGDGLVASSNLPSNLDWFISTGSGADGMTLKFNPDSLAIKNLGNIENLCNLKFKLVYETKFKKYIANDDLSLVSEYKFSIKNGTVKLSAAPGTVVLDKNDRFDSKVLKLRITDKDALDVNITSVSLPQGSCYDADLFYVGGGYAYVVIGWKGNSVPATVKSGKHKLSVYTGYNNNGIYNSNGSTNITVNIQ